MRMRDCRLTDWELLVNLNIRGTMVLLLLLLLLLLSTLPVRH